MRYLNQKELSDLAIIGQGINEIAGDTTESLFCYFEIGFKLPVMNSIGELVGHWLWNDEIDQHVFVPAKR